MTQHTAVPEKWAIDEHSVPKERYTDPEFLALELEKLFSQVWQPACREEEVPEPGSYYEYTVGRQSIVVVRQDDGSLKAFHNSCAHRGMKLVRGCGRSPEETLRCGFHGWRYGYDGTVSFVAAREEFPDRSESEWNLREVHLGTWGGWVFISMAAEPEPLLQWLDPMVTALAPFRLQDMRYRWRRRTTLKANWKTAVDAFIEGYHTPGTHPQTMRYAQALRPSAAPARPEEFEAAPYTPSMAFRNHSRFVFRGRPMDADKISDERRAALASNEIFARSMQYQHLEVGGLVTERDYRAAEQLAKIEPGQVPPFVLYHQLSEALAREEGVDFPSMSFEEYFAGNGDWHVFPTMVLLVEKSCLLGYRMLPDAEDPNLCTFEMFTLEHFPPGEVPQTEWLVVENWKDFDGWGELPTQDLVNMGGIQAGLHSDGFQRLWLNTVQESSVYNEHVIADRFLFGIDRGDPAAEEEILQSASETQAP